MIQPTPKPSDVVQHDAASRSCCQKLRDLASRIVQIVLDFIQWLFPCCFKSTTPLDPNKVSSSSGLVPSTPAPGAVSSPTSAARSVPSVAGTPSTSASSSSRSPLIIVTPPAGSGADPLSAVQFPYSPERTQSASASGQPEIFSPKFAPAKSGASQPTSPTAKTPSAAGTPQSHVATPAAGSGAGHAAAAAEEEDLEVHAPLPMSPELKAKLDADAPSAAPASGADGKDASGGPSPGTSGGSISSFDIPSSVEISGGEDGSDGENHVDSNNPFAALSEK